MLQRVSFPVAGRDVIGTLHLPDGRVTGGAVVLHGYGGHPEQPHIVATCEALAGTGIGALRFAYRDHEPPRMTLDTALADAKAALVLLRAHPQVRDGSAVVGFSFGGSVAARVAGADRKLRAAVLAAAPAALGGDDRPLREIARTRARMLLLWGSRDTEVPAANAERYATVLETAKVKYARETIEGGDHDFAPAGPRTAMAAAVAAWVTG